MQATAATIKGQMIRIKLRTSDKQWADRNGVSTTDNSATGGSLEVIVDIHAEITEWTTFAGKQMLRFNIQQIDKRIPRDYPNALAVIPHFNVMSN